MMLFVAGSWVRSNRTLGGFEIQGGMDIMTGWREWAMDGFWRNCSSLSRMGFLDLEVGGKIVS